MKRLALLFTGAIILSGCSSLVARQEAQLDAAGFKAIPADTPERQALLTGLPARQFVQGRDGDFITYTYADPLVCGCLYVGPESAYAAYRGLLARNSSSAGIGGAGLNSRPNPESAIH
jgi:hypothetical protein